MEIWRHVKTDSLYLVLGNATCSTNGHQDEGRASVVYYSLTYQRWFYRKVTEFYDGRFVKVDAPEWKPKQPILQHVPMNNCDNCGHGYEYCKCVCHDCGADLFDGFKWETVCQNCL